MMDTPSSSLRDTLLRICMVIMIILLGILVYALIFQERDSYGISVYEVNASKASGGNVTHLTEKDMETSQALRGILQRDSSSLVPQGNDERYLGAAKVNAEEYYSYKSRYPYSSFVNGTLIRNYYEYNDEFLFLAYNRGDVRET